MFVGKFADLGCADEIVDESDNVLWVRYSHFYLLSRDFPLPLWIITANLVWKRMMQVREKPANGPTNFRNVDTKSVSYRYTKVNRKPPNAEGVRGALIFFSIHES
jgi:hypothetical protein